MIDLDATKTDVEFIRRMASSMSVAQIFENHDATKEEVRQTCKEVMVACKEIVLEGKRCTLFFYCGGHGASHNEKQVYLFNGSTPNEVLYHIEDIL